MLFSNSSKNLTEIGQNVEKILNRVNKNHIGICYEDVDLAEQAKKDPTIISVYKYASDLGCGYFSICGGNRCHEYHAGFCNGMNK